MGKTEWTKLQSTWFKCRSKKSKTDMWKKGLQELGDAID